MSAAARGAGPVLRSWQWQRVGEFHIEIYESVELLSLGKLDRFKCSRTFHLGWDASILSALSGFKVAVFVTRAFILRCIHRCISLCK